MGANWILLRGWARSAGHWADFPQKLKAAFPEDSFECLDLPGAGTRCEEMSPTEISDIVQKVRAQCQAVQGGKKIHVFAVSLGGMVAAEWARQYPGDIEKLVLVNTSASNFSKFSERLRFANFPTIVKVFTEKSIEVQERLILGLISNSEENKTRAWPVWVAESKAHPVRLINAGRQLLAASRFRFPATAPVKTFFLGSSQDRLVSVRCTERLAKAWNSPLFLHPWAGHDLPLDDSEWTIHCLKKMQ